MSFTYPNGSHPVLDDVSFSLEQGQVLTILGKNGSGKSTLLNCMLNLLTPQQGELLLDGRDVSRMNAKEIASKVSYVQQMNQITFDYSVFQYVQMGRAHTLALFGKPSKEDDRITWKALETLGILSLADQPFTELSGGEQQKAAIARALTQEPKVIIFDEPTAHLDIANEHQILHLVLTMSKNGYTVIMTTHNPEHALLLNGLTILLGKDGKLVVGDSEDVVTEARLSEVYGVGMRLVYVPEIGRMACFVGG